MNKVKNFVNLTQIVLLWDDLAIIKQVLRRKGNILIFPGVPFSVLHDSCVIYAAGNNEPIHLVAVMISETAGLTRQVCLGMYWNPVTKLFLKE